MKKLAAVALTVSAMLVSSLTAFAVTPAYIYEAQRATKAVTYDGIVSDDEWDDAVKLVVNADNEVFQEYGRFQVGSATVDELSCTYYIKWDDEFLYIAEQRLDADGLHNDKNIFGRYDPENPWFGDGTAFFLAVDGEERKDIRWIPYVDDNDQNCAIWMSGQDVVTETWDVKGGKDGDVYTIEFAMPWSALGVTPAEGVMLRFCPIITSRNSIDQYSQWGEEVQINFYDSYIKEGLENSEDPNYHAGIRLVAAVGSAEQAPAEQAPDSDEQASDSDEQAPAIVSEEAPKSNAETGEDITIIVIAVVALVASVGGFIFLRKKDASKKGSTDN